MLLGFTRLAQVHIFNYFGYKQERDNSSIFLFILANSSLIRMIPISIGLIFFLNYKLQFSSRFKGILSATSDDALLSDCYRAIFVIWRDHA